jgi:hypothetical protein
MTHELHRLITAWLPSTSTVHLTALTIEQASVGLQLTATAPTASCPCCTVPSSSVHSRYGRHVTDFPWGALAVRIHLIVRKFICKNASCARRIFTERLPAFVAPYARKTTRLITTLRAMGVALGGNAGARLAARLRRSTSPATLYLIRRWRESGADSRQLWREIRALGYTHSARTVCRFITQRRRRDGISTPVDYFRHPSHRASVPHGDRKPPIVHGTT